MGPIEPVNPYEPPKAELDAAPASGQLASLENAVAGRYHFQVGEVMSEAWGLVKGMKASFWGAAIVIGIIYLVFDALTGVVVGQVLHVPPEGVAGQIYKAVFNMIVGGLLAPLTLGLEMMCVRRALGQPISFATAFAYFSKIGTILAGAFIALLLTCLGFVVLIIPGIYLSIAYQMTYKLIGDQPISAWAAVETSRKAIHHQWWGVLGLNLVVGLLTTLSALGLLIPLIWTFPWAMMTTGVLYKRIFYAPTPVPPATAPAPVA
jgi:uncharacterized membrane protein